MSWGKSDAKEYEDHVERALKRKYPKTMWEMEEQSPVVPGVKEKVDFRLKNRKTGRQILVDAKSGTLSIDDLRQIEDYKRTAKVKDVIIYTPTRIADIREGIKQRAKKQGIKIVHSKARSTW